MSKWEKRVIKILQGYYTTALNEENITSEIKSLVSKEVKEIIGEDEEIKALRVEPKANLKLAKLLESYFRVKLRDEQRITLKEIRKSIE
jgi:hypothetical protein